MARIVILEHELQRGLGLPYMAYALAQLWRSEGHEVVVHHGIDDPPEADLAILHVDLTVVPQTYRAQLSRYSRVVNGALVDVSRRRFSRLLVTRDDLWPGPVIVKTLNNFGGKPEQLLRNVAGRRGLNCDFPIGPVLQGYPVFRTIAEVPERVWSTFGLVVEKFIPERDVLGFYIHHWVFLGDAGRCARFRANVPIIKSDHFVSREAVDVPRAIREARAVLGMEYGKLDFVRAGEDHFLIDVNRTPSIPAILNDEVRKTLRTVADGLRGFLPG